MGTPYTPNPAAPLGIITVPADTDPRNAAVFNVPMQAVADGVAFVSARGNPLADLTALAAITTPANGLVRAVLGQGDYVFQTSYTTGIFPFRVAAADATPGGWQSNTAHQTSKTTIAALADLPTPTILATAITPVDPAAAGFFSYNAIAAGSADAFVTSTGTFAGVQWNTAVTTASAIAKALRFGGLGRYLIDGATLASVTLRCQGATGHAALPLLMPKIAVVRIGADGAQQNLLSTGLATDASASTAVYQAAHSIVITPDQNAVIDTTNYAYAIYLFGEGNTNAVVGQILYSLSFAMVAIPDARRS
jgi:hypothetical protein